MNKSAQVGKYVYSTKLIGKGSFSRVYKGLDTETDVVVALKIIEKTNLKSEIIDRLHDEIALLTKLQHPNITELKEFLEDDDNFYLILEYCAGGDLSLLIKKGKIPEEICRRYMQQMANALQYLKTRNIIHRDLKPQNILLTADLQTIKLTDFNFARELYDNDLAQTLCGSPLYMAPEIIEKHEYTVKSDLWSVGMILYEMVYGKSPYWDAFNIMDLINKIKTRPVAFSNRASAECNSLLGGLLQVNPDQRYTWGQFFSHSWLRPEEPKYITEEQNNLWESISLSTITPNYTMSLPRQIASSSQRFQVDLVDNYVPLGITPPRYTQSEPIRIITKDAPEQKEHEVHEYMIKRFRANSVPDNKSTVTDNLWSYMTSSVGIIKGAVDYLASTTPKGLRISNPQKRDD